MTKKTRIQIPGYRIRKLRGEGAMATVYRAIHKGLNKPVALKVLHEGVAKDPDYRERFVREGRAAARLSHRNIVRAYEAGEHEGLFYFAMEYVDGEDLGERLCREETLDEREALRIAIEVSAALAEAEAHDMVHRDVKPENVLLGKDGEVKLADLGLAKVEGDGFLTAEGFTLGTVAFFSPEQCRGSRGLDIRSDLYAVGALLYMMLGGRLPFGRGDNPALTMEAILQDEPEPIVVEPMPSAPTLQAVSTLMAKRRDERPRSALDAKDLLEDVLAQLDGAAPRHGSGSGSGRKPTRRRRRSARTSVGAKRSAPIAPVLVMASVGVVIGGGLAALGLRSQPASPPPAEPSATARAPRREAPPAPPAPAAAPPAAKAKPEPAARVPKPLPPARPALVKPAPNEAEAPPPGPLDVGKPATSSESTPTPDSTARGAPAPTTLAFDWDEADALSRWTCLDDQVEIKHGGLLFKVPPRGEGTLALKSRLRLPVEVSYSVRVTTKAIGRNGVLWTTLGPADGQGLASFGGAALYRLGAGDPLHLAGRRKPQALFGGRRRKVRIVFGTARTEGWVDGRPFFSETTQAQSGPLRLAFQLARGVGIDLRDLVITAPFVEGS